MNSLPTRLVYAAAAISLAGAAIHVAAIVGGPSWYQFFGAPPRVVDSAHAGTWLAPVSAAAIAFLMGVCALYACSALGLVRRLPMLRLTLAGIAAICLLRGLVVLPLAFTHPALRTPFEVIAALVWATAGLGFVAGFFAARPYSPSAHTGRGQARKSP
jgi:hypothetical protein